MFVLPRPAAFAVSLVTHGLILAWVASGPVREKPPSLYDMTVKPRASKLIFYNFRERLPDVAPSRPRASAKPARAERKLASHHIVAGSPKSPRARQFVYTPAPKLEIHADLRSPNILAIHAAPPAPPRKPRLFTPPPERPKPVSAASVPVPPEIAAARNLSGPGNLLGVHPVKAPPRQFAAPRAGRRAVRPAPTLPDAPSLVAAATLAAPSALSGPAPKAPPREFQAPRATARPSPPGAPLPDAPSLPDSPSSAPVTMAIVGLDPALNAPPPAPDGARAAQFSAGPKIRKDGGEGSADKALLSVPGLLVRSGADDAKPTSMARAAPTSAGNIHAAIASAGHAPNVAASPHAAATRVASAPDPLWHGRETYAMTVQMPNVTSYSGSWMMWFSQRAGGPGAAANGALTPPVPLRKVDPKYIPAAVAERIEGRVRLTAIIRRNGSVDSVNVLEHLDDRLDKSAQNAVHQWLFEPALRDGQAVDVDAVIEIPFRLAPQTLK